MLVHGFLFTTGAHSFAREMGIPDVSVQTFPMFAPTRAFPNVALAKIPPGGLSYFSHWFATQIFRYGGNNGYYQLRRRLPVDLPRKAVLAIFADARLAVDTPALCLQPDRAAPSR